MSSSCAPRAAPVGSVPCALSTQHNPPLSWLPPPPAPSPIVGRGVAAAVVAPPSPLGFPSPLPPRGSGRGAAQVGGCRGSLHSVVIPSPSPPGLSVPLPRGPSLGRWGRGAAQVGAVAVAGGDPPCPPLVSVGRRCAGCTAARPRCNTICNKMLHIAIILYICSVIVFGRKVTNLLIISHESQINESTNRGNPRGS